LGLTDIPRIERGIVKLAPHAEAVGGVLASYAFTIAGFLSVTATFLYTLGDKPFFRLYSRRGSFGDLMFIHALAFIVLAAIFAVSIVVLVSPRFLSWAIGLTAFSVVQLGALTLISYLLTSRAQASGSSG
jgi:hypothetical protein